MTTAAFNVGDRVEWLLQVGVLGRKDVIRIPVVVLEIIDLRRLLVRQLDERKPFELSVREVRRLP